MKVKQNKSNKRPACKEEETIKLLLQKVDMLLEDTKRIISCVAFHFPTEEEYQAELDGQADYEKWIYDEWAKYDNGEVYDHFIDNII